MANPLVEIPYDHSAATAGRDSIFLANRGMFSVSVRREGDTFSVVVIRNLPTGGSLLEKITPAGSLELAMKLAKETIEATAS